MSLLVIDVGTSSVRAIMEPDASMHRRAAAAAAARLARARDGRVRRPGPRRHGARSRDRRAHRARRPGRRDRHHQPARSTIVWDRATGEPIGPAIGWQDLRTIGMCLEQQANGFRFAPNVSATKIAYLLDTYDPDRTRDLCFGTVDSWITWILTQGDPRDRRDQRGDHRRAQERRVGLVRRRARSAAHPRLDDADARRHERDHRAGDRAPGRAADRRRSSVTSRRRCSGRRACGRARRRSRSAPAGCSTWCWARTGRSSRPAATAARSRSSRGGSTASTPGGSRRSCSRRARTWSGCATTSASSPARTRATRSRSSAPTPGGVVFVPALLGLGTPQWDFGARHRARPHPRHRPARARPRGARRRRAARRRPGRGGRDRRGPPIEVLRIDGGMSRNPTFVQALADAAQKPVEVSPVKEATTLGAGFLAGLAVGTVARPRRAGRDVEPDAPMRARSRPRSRTLARRRRACPPLDPGPLDRRLLTPRLPAPTTSRLRALPSTRSLPRALSAPTRGGHPLRHRATSRRGRRPTQHRPSTQLRVRGHGCGANPGRPSHLRHRWPVGSENSTRSRMTNCAIHSRPKPPRWPARTAPRCSVGGRCMCAAHESAIPTVTVDSASPANAMIQNGRTSRSGSLASVRPQVHRRLRWNDGTVARLVAMTFAIHASTPKTAVVRTSVDTLITVVTTETLRQRRTRWTREPRSRAAGATAAVAITVIGRHRRRTSLPARADAGAVAQARCGAP